MTDNDPMTFGNGTEPGVPIKWSVPITGPDPSAEFQVCVQCRGIPTDGQLGFRVESPGPPIPPAIVPLTTIVSPSMTLGVLENGWPAGAPSTVEVTYVPGATPPPQGSSITVGVMILAT